VADLPSALRRVAVFIQNGRNDYQEMQRSDCEQAARRHGFDIKVWSADSDSDTQVRQIRGVLSGDACARPAALLVSPVREVALMPVAYEALRLGIGWVLLNRWHDSMLDLYRQFPSTLVFSIAPDQLEAGRIQARQARTLLGGDAELLCIRGPLGTFSTVKRTAGFKEELGSLPSVKTTVFHGDWSIESGESIMRDWLSAFGRGHLPKVVVAAQNDAMAMGARSAFLGHGRGAGLPPDGRLRVLGCDGSPTVGQRLVQTGELSATVIIPSVGGAAIDHVEAVLAGGRRPPPEIVVGVRSFPELGALAPRRNGRGTKG